MAKRKATEDQFIKLHNLVTDEFLKRIKSEATARDLKAACDWLHKNDINGVAYEGNRSINWQMFYKLTLNWYNVDCMARELVKNPGKTASSGV